MEQGRPSFGYMQSGEASTLRKLIGEGGRPMKVTEISIAGISAPVGIWSLTHLEMMMANSAAMYYVHKTLGMPDLRPSDDLALMEVEIFILAQALRDPNKPTNQFANANELRELLTPDELKLARNKYFEFVDERSPIKNLKSDEEVRAFVEGVGKGLIPATYLYSCDMPSLVRSLMFAASRAIFSMTLKSSLDGAVNISSESSTESGISSQGEKSPNNPSATPSHTTPSESPSPDDVSGDVPTLNLRG